MFSNPHQSNSFFQSAPENALDESALIEKLKPMLNSQRIQYIYDSYGVEILHQTHEIRISNLYSTEGDINTMRTCAIVNFERLFDHLLAEAHQLIVAGGSIGETLKAKGFAISKTPLYFGECELPLIAKEQMHTQAKSAAVHIYCLQVNYLESKPKLDYCTITEIHHPEYLSPSRLSALYPDEYDAHCTSSFAIQPHLAQLSELDSRLSQNRVVI